MPFAPNTHCATAPVYLDHAATTPVSAEVLDAMAPLWQQSFANPASLHTPGRQAKQHWQWALDTLAEVFFTQPADWILTSGGTEADNLAILGVARAQKQARPLATPHLIVSAIEHAAVLEAARFLEAYEGFHVSYLPVDACGRVTVETLEAAIRPETVLVSVMHGNNEVGTLQPIDALGSLCRARGVPFHTDAVQTAGKLPLDLSQLPVDYLTLSAHKLYGPKGVGALYCHPHAPRPQPLVYGGDQQQGLRPGTVPVYLAVGLAAALQQCVQQQATEIPRLWALTTHLQQQLQMALGDAFTSQPRPAGTTVQPNTRLWLNGPAEASARVPGLVNLSVPGREGEALVLNLDLQGFAVSSGSACHSGRQEPSSVLLAMGADPSRARGSVRIALGRSSTQADLDRLVAALVRLLPTEESLLERRVQGDAT
ncbi:MAG: cysteine desulfurase family protein [Candidatus Melainabacteria bacterium]|nr:cysteine desulfurase family protein [Candidatus Melainabacteria bacterium]